MAILQTSDFTGEFKVSKTRFTDLDKYISKYEEHYLVRLLGADLYALFIADLTVGTPQTPQAARFKKIYDPFNSIPTFTTLVISEGIKKMLIQFVYFHYIRDSSTFNTVVGTVSSDNENASKVTPNAFNLIEAYNLAVTTYQSIQCYLVEEEQDYPELINSYFDHLQVTSGI